jgi:hypothetical protein
VLHLLPDDKAHLKIPNATKEHLKSAALQVEEKTERRTKNGEESEAIGQSTRNDEFGGRKEEAATQNGENVVIEFFLL